jgi:hypothetical protein
MPKFMIDIKQVVIERTTVEVEAETLEEAYEQDPNDWADNFQAERDFVEISERHWVTPDAD